MRHARGAVLNVCDMGWCRLEAMPDSAPPHTRLIAARQSLGACVRAFVTRSTVEAPLAKAEDRLNRFPATPMCCITWFLEGDVEMIEPPPPDPLPVFERALFVGPQTRPSITYNPGPVRTFMVMFYPQAMHTLCGINVSAWVDRWMPVAGALGPEWAAMADAVLTAPDDTTRLEIIHRFLEPRWQAARQLNAVADAGDWVRHLALQAAGSEFGRGVRNIERRIKAWAGQPMRTLRRMQRAEQTFFEARDGHMGRKQSMSDVAAHQGYADQAHMCRETRAITGHSPLEITRVLDGDDESYWIYRIWF
jgi:AraC-like DNA-binding protein